jgi:hypothetical protein
MKPKRAPGAGRKPQGEFTGKTATFTSRITPELRLALEQEAAQNRRSLSQEVERRLRDSLEMPKRIQQDWYGPQNWALAKIVVELADTVEAVTDEKWLKSAFAFQALKTALEVILDRLAPDGPVTTPKQVEESAKQLEKVLGPGTAEQAMRPEYVGAGVAGGFWEQIRLAKKSPLNRPAEENLIPHIRDLLGLKSHKDQDR